MDGKKTGRVTFSRIWLQSILLRHGTRQKEVRTSEQTGNISRILRIFERMWSVEEKKVILSRGVTFAGAPEGAPTAPKSIFPREPHPEAETAELPSEIRMIEVDTTPLNVDTINHVPGGPEDDTTSHDSNDDEEAPRPQRGRGPGRPRIIRTGQRGRPRRQHQPSRENAEFDGSDLVNLAEVPFRSAMHSNDAEHWLKAIVSEVESILQHDTWKLVDRPKDKEVIGSRFVLRNKNHADGTLERRKARLVARGFAQRPGFHFNDTFAPVARMSSIRLLTSLSARRSMHIRHLDIASAYLNGDIDEELFMEPPQLLEDALRTISTDRSSGKAVRERAASMLRELQTGDKVCLLKKALYGLRQADRSWHRTLDASLRRCEANEHRPMRVHHGWAKRTLVHSGLRR